MWQTKAAPAAKKVQRAKKVEESSEEDSGSNSDSDEEHQIKKVKHPVCPLSNLFKFYKKIHLPFLFIYLAS